MKRKAAVIVGLLALLAPVIAQAFSTSDLLSLVVMPLAVAAVADLPGVPVNQLADFVASLNQAAVPPSQFVEVLRYVPVALVNQNSVPQPVPFVDWVQTQVTNGVTGPTLVTLIEQRLPDYGITPQIIVTAPAPRYFIDRQQEVDYFPLPVRTRISQAGNNPHGGPPGQLKKIEGVQTGAEIVHGRKPGRQFDNNEEVARHVVGRTEIDHGNRGKGHGKGHAKKMNSPDVYEQPDGNGGGFVPPGQAKKMNGDQGGPHGGPAGGVPPGQAKKEGGGNGHGKH